MLISVVGTNAPSASDFKIALVAFVGVLAGALIGLVGTWLSARQSSRLEEQGQLRRLYADFFEQSGVRESLEMEADVLDELMEPFHAVMGTSEPGDEHIATMSDENARNYRQMVEGRRETSLRLVDIMNRLQHIKFQAQLIAPRDTAQAIAAHVEASDDSTVATLNEAVILLGRRDLSVGADRLRTRRDVRDLLHERDYVRVVEEYEQHRRNREPSGGRDGRS